MQLRKIGVVRTSLNTRSSRDERVRVNRVIVAYQGPKGEEYRKAFETKDPMCNVNAPDRGTHDELNALRYQW